VLNIKLCLNLQYQHRDFTTSGGVSSVWGRPGCLRCRLFDAAWNWSGFIPTRQKIELDFYFTWSISHSELRRVSCRLVFLSQVAVSPTTHTVKGNERILTYKKHRVVAKCSLLLCWNYAWVMQSQFRLMSWFCRGIQTRDIISAQFFSPFANFLNKIDMFHSASKKVVPAALRLM
jgi:hypothetical protein